MGLKKTALVGVCLGVLAASAAPRASAQIGCNMNQDAAVRCFVMNAMKTDLAGPHFGMTTKQFQAYGIAVARILQSQHTYLVLVGTSSAVADAMPPTNADGSPNSGAQSAAVNALVSAALADGFTTTPSEVNLQELQWFTLDLVTSMNQNDGYMQLLTPGVGLRLIDSYVVTGTTNGSPNWAQINSSLSAAIDNLLAAGMIKLPAGISISQVKAFVGSLAQAIYDYKLATGRTTL